MKISERTILIDEPEYIASYHTTDLGDGKVMTFFHLDIFYFSAQVLKKMQKHWKLIRKAFPCVFYTMADDESEAWRKLVRKFGFRFLSTTPCSDGKERSIFVHFPIASHDGA